MRIKKTALALCAALMAAPLGIATAPAMAQGFSFSVGPDGPRVGFYTAGPNAWYNGHRGYRHRRDGWREYRGWWFPPDAFGPPRYHRPPPPRHAVSAAHVRWCANRYRSYRDWANTFPPSRGPRQQGYSPYSRPAARHRLTAPVSRACEGPRLPVRAFVVCYSLPAQSRMTS